MDAMADESGTRWPVYSMDEVAVHCSRHDAWIVVHDKVYNLTPHIENHEGWSNGSKQTTLLAILSAMGEDCTDDFEEVHSPAAWKQLLAFRIGTLAQPNRGRRRVTFRTWDELKSMGVV